MSVDKLRENLADYAHETWSGWMKYMFFVCTELDRTKKEVVFRIPAKTYDRWMRQVGTPYSRLPELEKDSDRREADRIIAICSNYYRHRCTY